MDKEQAIQETIKAMAIYRASLSKEVITDTIEFFSKQAEPKPMAETDQDIWWAYLEELKLRSSG